MNISHTVHINGILTWMKTQSASSLLSSFTVHHSLPAVQILQLRCSSHTKSPTVPGDSILSLMSLYLFMVGFSLEYFLQSSNLANCYLSFKILLMATSFKQPQLNSSSRVNYSQICIPIALAYTFE